METSGAELLKLLISPLYGDRPEFGIRELLQNAVDACRELQDYLAQRQEVSSFEAPSQSADVLISLEQKGNGTRWVHVSDCGVGMTVSTIRDYYLKAGASFRNSDAWRKQHEDERGKPRVLRSGHFGIGVLAGFLLGDEISLSTRHVTSKLDEGIAFTCRLDDDVIEMNRIRRPVGTTISIKLTDHAYDSLLGSSTDRANPRERPEVGEEMWDWYCLTKPSVERILLPQKTRLKQQYTIPSNSSSLPANWRQLSFDGFDDIHWSYQANAPRLVCNGIIVRGDRSSRQEDQPGWSLFEAPKISIFDSRGTLPLNLQRTALTVDTMVFDEALREEVHRDFLAYLIVNTPTKSVTESSALQSYQRLRYPGLDLHPWYWCGQDGLSFLSSWHLKQLSVSRLIYVLLDEARYLRRMIRKSSKYCVVPLLAKNSDNTVRMLLGYCGRGRRGHYPTDNIHTVANRIVGRRYEIEQLRERAKERDWRSRDEDEWSYRDNNYGPLERFTDESLTKTWAMLCDSPNLAEDIDLLSPFELPERDLASLLVSYITIEAGNSDISLSDAWKRIIDLPYIPYNLRARKRLLSKAYKELASYIKSWMETKDSPEKDLDNSIEDNENWTFVSLP